MASLVGQQLKDTYDSLLKTSDNDALGGTYKEITDGSGNGSNLYLGTGGKVGIGTDSPSAKMTIEDGDFARLDLNLANSTGTTIADIRGLVEGTEKWRIGKTSSSLDDFAINVTSTERMRINSGGDISFRDTSNNEAFYWDASTARLGLGTTSPATILDIRGSSPVINVNATNASGECAINLTAIGSDGVSNALTQIAGIPEGAGLASAIKFQTRNSAGTISEKMRIDSSGNVGIGTSSPSERLQVVDSANDIQVRLGSDNAGINPTLRFHGKNTADTTNVYADIRVNPDNQTLGFSGTGTSGGSIEQDAMVINSSGKVGIGTSSPNETLSLYNSNRPYIQFTSATTGTTSADGFFMGFASSNGDFQIRNKEAQPIDFWTSDQIRMRILSTGGITFNGDTASANALDDYEEGTWTPEYTPTSGSFATMDMDIVTAKYTKIGNVVTVYAYIRTDDVDVTGGTGAVRISGLPFNVSNFGGGISFGRLEGFVGSPDGGYFVAGSADIQLQETNTSESLDVADLTDGTNANSNLMMFAGTYMVS